jgi:hypothetical protein
VDVGVVVEVDDDEVDAGIVVDVLDDDEVDAGIVVDVLDDDEVDVDEVDDVELVVEELVVPVGTVLDVLDVVVEEVLDDVVGNDEVVVGRVVLVLVVDVDDVDVVDVVEVVEVVDVVVPVMTTWLKSPHPWEIGRLLASPGYCRVQRYVPGTVGVKSDDVATPLASMTLVEEKTSTVHAASLNSRNVTLPVGGNSPRKVTESRTAVPTGPPADGVATMEGGRRWITSVKVWHAELWLVVAHTVVGPNDPAWLGLPTRMPGGERVRPGGTAPAVTVYVGFSRLLVNWWP